MNTQISAKSSPGRPAGRSGDKVRADLLQVARNHFLARDFKAVSLRQIADEAGVNPAMVSYYFGDKRGLYLAIVEEVTQILEESLQGMGDGNQIAVEDFSEIYAKFLADNPWWPNFLIREVLFGEGDVRDAVMQKFSAATVPGLMAAINSEIVDGNFRDDLDPSMALISLLGMTIFPFLAKPVVEKVLNIEINPKTVEKLAKHNTKVFLHGVSKKERGNT